MSAVSQPAPFQVGARLLEFLAEGHPTKLDKLVDAMDLAHDDSGAALLREAVDRLVGMGYLRVFDPAKKRSKGGSLCEITDAGVKLVQEYEGGRLADYLARVWDSESDSSNEPEPDSEPQSEPGTRFQWTSQPEMQVDREAKEAIPELKAEQYAGALASFFEGAKEECTFGLFGHWGRGKTFLMKRTAERLHERPDRKWVTVSLSAWEHPTSTEMWVQLYEQTVKNVLKAGGISELTLALRVTMLRFGPMCLVPGLTLLALSLLPFMQVAGWFLGGLTAAGIASLFAMVRGFRRAGKQLPSNLVSLVRHGEKLGLQSIVGEDLRLLLCSWSPWTEDRRTDSRWSRICFLARHFRLLTGSMILVVLLTLGIAALIWSREGLELLVALWLMVPVMFLLTLFWEKDHGRPKRVLLVVDDLDRCSPTSVVGVMSAVKLLLARSDVQLRMAATFLVDERVLRVSIRKRAESEGLPVEDENRMRESIEKLLIGHLRLQQISKDELKIVLKRTLDESLPDRAVKDDAEQSKSGVAIQESSSGSSGEARDLAGSTGNRETQNVSEGQERHSEDLSVQEVAQVQDALDELAEEAWNMQAGPRSIRAFWIRYRLARQLAFQLGAPYSPADLARELIRPYVEGMQEGEMESAYLQANPKLLPIVQQVR